MNLESLFERSTISTEQRLDDVGNVTLRPRNYTLQRTRLLVQLAVGATSAGRIVSNNGTGTEPGVWTCLPTVADRQVRSALNSTEQFQIQVKNRFPQSKQWTMPDV